MPSRPSKYASVVQHLPKFPGHEPERVQLIQAVKDKITTAEVTTYNVGAQIRTTLLTAHEHIGKALALGKLNAAGKPHAAGFAGGYADARAILDAINDWKSSAQLLVDAYESLMLERMEGEGVASLRLENGASVSTYSEPYGKVVDKEAFRLWCIAPAEICMRCELGPDATCHGDEREDQHPFHPGGGFEKQLQLWPATMNAVAKERTLAGAPPPDGVEVTAITRVRLNKA